MLGSVSRTNVSLRTLSHNICSLQFFSGLLHPHCHTWEHKHTIHWMCIGQWKQEADCVLHRKTMNEEWQNKNDKSPLTIWLCAELQLTTFVLDPCTNCYTGSNFYYFFPKCQPETTPTNWLGNGSSFQEAIKKNQVRSIFFFIIIGERLQKLPPLKDKCQLDVVNDKWLTIQGTQPSWLSEQHCFK